MSSGSNFYQAGADSGDPAAASNTGIRGTINVVATNVTGCLSFWVAEEMASNNVWGQVGYYLCDTNGLTPTAFYQVWNSGGVAAGGSAIVSTGSHQFSMYQQSGTTWDFAVDGTVIGTVAMNSTTSSSSYPIEALSEEGYVSGPYNPPKVEFNSIQTLESIGWYSPGSGYEPYGCGGTLSCWGVAGNLQNASIPMDAIYVGGNVAPVSAGSWLWNGGTADFSLTASPTGFKVDSGAPGNSTVTVVPAGGFSGTVTLAVTTNSTKLSCTVSPATISGGSGTSRLACRGSSSGNYLATVTGASGMLSHTTVVSFQVEDFAIDADHAVVVVGLNSPGNSTITVSPLNGFSSMVDLAVTTNSTSFSCSLSVTTIVNGLGSSILSCVSQTAGDYLATIKGSEGILSHSVEAVYQSTNLPNGQPPGSHGSTVQSYLYEITAGVAGLVLLLTVSLVKRKQQSTRR